MDARASARRWRVCAHLGVAAEVREEITVQGLGVANFRLVVKLLREIWRQILRPYFGKCSLRI